MNANRLLALYDRVAEAPDAVSRLRHFVLDLAVRGKLVGQNPEDEPASELLIRIATEKARLMETGSLKRRKLTGSQSQHELGFLLPDGWVAATFYDVLNDLQTGPFGSSLHQSDYELGGDARHKPCFDSRWADCSDCKDGGWRKRAATPFDL